MIGPLWTLAIRSAWNRRASLLFVMLAIALSTFMLLSVERARNDLRSSFISTISGTDLIVGARTGTVQLLLYSVFHIGSPPNPMRYASIDALREMEGVAWVVPLAMGDSHRGFPVVATSEQFFEHFRHGRGKTLAFASGRVFGTTFEAVLGAEVAERHGYAPGRAITLAHGAGDGFGGHDHDDEPFQVVGVLERTGTPVDRSIYVPLQAMGALHAEVLPGLPGHAASHEHGHDHDDAAPPATVTAVLLGLKQRSAVFSVQGRIARLRDEPLMGVLPGAALDELWAVVGIGETVVFGLSLLVAVTSVAGLVAVILAGLNERRRELAMLRSVGAGPRRIVALLLMEGATLVGCGMAIGAVAYLAGMVLLRGWVQARTGVDLQPWRFSAGQARWLAVLAALGVAASLLPAWRAYRLALTDGLAQRT